MEIKKRITTWVIILVATLALLGTVAAITGKRGGFFKGLLQVGQVPEEQEPCEPNKWSCTGWSLCSEPGEQTRTCTLVKSTCPEATTPTKPAEKQTCKLQAELSPGTLLFTGTTTTEMEAQVLSPATSYVTTGGSQEALLPATTGATGTTTGSEALVSPYIQPTGDTRGVAPAPPYDKSIPCIASSSQSCEAIPGCMWISLGRDVGGTCSVLSCNSVAQELRCAKFEPQGCVWDETICRDKAPLEISADSLFQSKTVEAGERVVMGSYRFTNTTQNAIDISKVSLKASGTLNFEKIEKVVLVKDADIVRGSAADIRAKAVTDENELGIDGSLTWIAQQQKLFTVNAKTTATISLLGTVDASSEDGKQFNFQIDGSRDVSVRNAGIEVKGKVTSPALTIKKTQPPFPECKDNTWSCTEFNQCSDDGYQKRTCTLVPSGCATAKTGEKPSEEQRCTPPAKTLTCEDQGFYTYTGPSKPGVRQTGMCIECTTEEFIQRGGTCEIKAEVKTEPKKEEPKKEVKKEKKKKTTAKKATTKPSEKPKKAVPEQRPVGGAPGLSGSQRLVRAPERAKTGPEALLYIGIIAAVSGGLWFRRK